MLIVTALLVCAVGCFAAGCLIVRRARCRQRWPDKRLGTKPKADDERARIWKINRAQLQDDMKRKESL